MTVTTKIGCGGTVKGKVAVLGTGLPVETHEITTDLEGKILLVLGFMTREVAEKAGFVGVKGLVAESIHWRDFNYFKEENEFPLLILTKFGKLESSKELREKLGKVDGKEGEISGEAKTFKIG